MKSVSTKGLNKKLGHSVEKGLRDILRSAEWEEFRQLIDKSESIVEWGSGASTLYHAYYCSGSELFSIESDLAFAEMMNQRLRENPHRDEISRTGFTHVVHVDIGPTVGWGKPASYAHRRKFDNYIWPTQCVSGLSEADLYIVDGRFRVSVFLHCLLNGKSGARIYFDDYGARPEYHLVEEVISPTSHSKSCRAAVFTIPELSIEQRELAWSLADSFKYVVE